MTLGAVNMKTIHSAFKCTLLAAILFIVVSMLYINVYSERMLSDDKRDAAQMISQVAIFRERINKIEGVRSDQESLLSREAEKERNLTKDGKTDMNLEKGVVNSMVPTQVANKPTGGSFVPTPMRDIINDGGNLSSVPIKVDKTCKEQTNILLLKTHKTGGSTLQNVLYRFGDVRDLTFALPVTDVYMGSPVKFKPSFAVPSPTGQYNILANHARFQKENMRKIMAPGTKFITILRYPPKQFESTYSYYRMAGRFRCSLETFAASPKKFYLYENERNTRHSSLNPMLYDLGLELKALADPVKVQNWIHYIDDAFELVLIAEYLKESLILLKEMMCWSFEDITFLTSNARSGMLVENLANTTENNLLNWLDGDVRLYRHFNTTLWDKIGKYGVERMAADVAELDRRNEELHRRCVQGKKKVSEMGGNTVIERYVLRPDAAQDMTCKRITYAAYSYLTSLKHKMKMRRPQKKVGARR